MSTTVPNRFAVGELVDVTIRGARIVETYLYSTIVKADGWTDAVEFPNPGVTFARVAPAEWPPQSDDVWRDKNDNAWHAVGGPGRMIDRTGGGWSDAEEVLAEVGPMRLEYRPGWTPTPAAEPEPAEVDERAAMVTAIREFADWLEANTDLPLPYAVDAQAYPETLEAARSLADLYGARIARDDDQVLSAKVGIGDRANGYPLVNYTLYLTKPQPPMPTDEKIAAEPEPVAAVGMAGPPEMDADLDAAVDRVAALPDPPGEAWAVSTRDLHPQDEAAEQRVPTGGIQL